MLRAGDSVLPQHGIERPQAPLRAGVVAMQEDNIVGCHHREFLLASWKLMCIGEHVLTSQPRFFHQPEGAVLRRTRRPGESHGPSLAARVDPSAPGGSAPLVLRKQSTDLPVRFLETPCQVPQSEWWVSEPGAHVVRSLQDVEVAGGITLRKEKRSPGRHQYVKEAGWIAQTARLGRSPREFGDDSTMPDGTLPIFTRFIDNKETSDSLT